MQMGLRAGIEHGKKGLCVEQLAAYNPSAEEDYTAAIQELRNVEFPLVAQLSADKDASIEAIMDLLRLDESLARLPGMSDLQPEIDQLMVPVHRKEDQAVIGTRALTLSLGFSQGRIEKIRRNMVDRRSALEGVLNSLFGPQLHEDVIDEAGTSGASPLVTSVSTLSTTFATAIPIPSVSIEDYNVTGEDGQPQGQGARGASIGDALDQELTEEDFNFSA